MSQPEFTHDREGTGEDRWWADPIWDAVPAIDVPTLLVGAARLVVVSAHPDDETIGVGGTIAAASALGVPVVALLATRGEGSHPDSDVWSPAAVAQVRAAEWRTAIAALAPQAQLVVGDLPDGALADHEAELAALLRPHVDDATLLLAPWSADGHPDHDAAGRVAQQVAADEGVHVLHFPIWWWHWSTPQDAADLVRERAVVVRPGPAAVHAKHVALRAYPSQHTGLGPGEGHGPIVTAQVQVRARRQQEVVFTGPDTPRPAPSAAPDGRADRFEAMYDEGDDPWHHEDSFYERRRRDLVMAVLGRDHYDRVLEIGCATGLLTAALVQRADALVATDVSARALQVAQSRGLERVTWVHGTVPRDLPDGPFDLVVVSEVGYFLRPDELAALLRHAGRTLTPDGELLAAHWRRPTTDIPSDGALVHEQIGASFGRPRRAAYADDDVLIEVWGSGPSAAAREGLT